MVFEVVAFERARDGILYVLFADAASGEPAGGAQVEIGSTSAQSLALDVFPAWQRRGVATFFDNRLCTALIKLGVERVTMYAGGGGSYAWARCGYEVAGGQEGLAAHVQSIRPAIERAVREGYADEDQAAVLLAGVRDGTLTTTRQVSEFGRKDAWTDATGHTMWLGRLAFDGWKWSGIKYLRTAAPDDAARD